MTVSIRGGRIVLELSVEETARFLFGKEVEGRDEDSGGPYRVVVRMMRPRRGRKAQCPS